MEWGHELYCLGHLLQAGAARARTIGPDALLDLCTRAADLVCEAFGPDGLQSVCGHPEIEPALTELYRVTGNRNYLDQAALFIERRGHQVLNEIEFGRSYFQDDVPIREAAYPSDGRIEITVHEAPATPVTLTLRVPHWADGATLTDGGNTSQVGVGYAEITRIL